MEGAELRIIEAAIAAVEEYGFNNVTVRRIAAKADVNIAAINYYFRTKEQLLDKVLELTIDNAFDWKDLAHTESLPPKEQLFAIMDHLTQGAQNFPETTRAHFYEAMVNGNTETRAVREMNRFMETVYQKFVAKGCRMAEKDLRASITQVFMTGLFALGVVPNIYRQFLQADLTEADDRRQFLRHLIDRLIED
ncbi:transcriptional regulator, TetR family [Sporobacter termitidis DSM 10068]|uniref:Transcriptional regulator, TetR family n=1 Tax=Sporobacter termitidis DSM 10068 TaxID=1123282 RepID=A0A1M5ZGD5_9FIRM|nr:TetR/AcrR family transcriptional regulator [Sporobacter termitidis]SHI23326.1 transcriptional regulator, TetR family [Sporobacter termitidis DSM 10068]